MPSKDDVRKRAWAAIRGQRQENSGGVQLANPSPTIVNVSEHSSQYQLQRETCNECTTLPGPNYLTLNSGVNRNDNVAFVDTEIKECVLQLEDLKKMVCDNRRDTVEMIQSLKVQIQEISKEIRENKQSLAVQVQDVKKRLDFIYGKKAGRQS